MTPLLLLACTVDRSLHLVPFAVQGQLSASPSPWTVHIEEATLALARVRLITPPEVARGPRPRLIRSAHAHPGHEPDGGVDGEWIGPATVDLLGDAAALGDAALWSGPYASGQLSFGHPALVLAGTVAASASDAATPFRFELGAVEEVHGLPFEVEVALIPAPAGLTLAADPMAMLGDVDWATADEDGDGALTLADGNLTNQVTFGAASLRAWSLTLTP